MTLPGPGGAHYPEDMTILVGGVANDFVCLAELHGEVGASKAEHMDKRPEGIADAITLQEAAKPTCWT